MIENVNLVKLSSGEELIAGVSDLGSRLYLDQPYAIGAEMIGGNLRVGMFPFCVYRKDPERNKISVDKSHVVYMTAPSEQILSQYTQQTSRIAVAAASDLQLLKG